MQGKRGMDVCALRGAPEAAWVLTMGGIIEELQQEGQGAAGGE